MSPTSKAYPPVAIIGAGITGLVLALSLEYRNIPYAIYEQARAISTAGAGLNTNPAGARSLKYAHPEAYAAYQEVKSRHHRHDENNYMTYTDGVDDFKVMCTEEFGSVHRVRFVEKLVERVPQDKILLSKRVRSVTRHTPQDPLLLSFEDGSTAHCDVVLGCDGIKSTIRSLVVGPDHPSAKASFSHCVVYRGLIDRKKVQQAIGAELTDGALLHASSGAYFVSYPATEELMSIGLFMPHPEPWPYFPSVSHRANKSELLSVLQDSQRNVQSIAKLLPETLDVWAIYDTQDNPLPKFAEGCMAVLGDAAHASSPNLGAGAGIAYEDVCVVSSLLSDITELSRDDQDAFCINQTNLQHKIEIALSAYSAIRLQRSHWLVKESRYLSRCYTLQEYGSERDIERMKREVIDRYNQVWVEDIADIVQNARNSRDEENNYNR